MLDSTANLGRSCLQPGDIILKVSFGVEGRDVNDIAKVKVKGLQEVDGVEGPEPEARHTPVLGNKRAPRPGFNTKHCRTTVGPNIQLLWKQTDFDFTVRQCLIPAENRAC